MKIKTSTKNTIISCLLTAILAIPATAVTTTKIIKLNQKQEQNQSITVNIGNEEISVDSDYVKKQEERIVELENTVKQLSDDNTTETIAVEENNKDAANTDAIYLNELNVLNFQRIYKGTWYSEEIPEWIYMEDKTATGDTYENAVKMRIAYDADSFVVDYYLDKKYTTFNGNFVLDESSKSTVSVADLKIYGDEKIIYQFKNITGGMPPKNTNDLGIENVEKLRFEITSESGGVGDYNDFGLVFYDSILK